MLARLIGQLEATMVREQPMIVPSNLWVPLLDTHTRDKLDGIEGYAPMPPGLIATFSPAYDVMYKNRKYTAGYAEHPWNNYPLEGVIISWEQEVSEHIVDGEQITAIAYAHVLADTRGRITAHYHPGIFSQWISERQHVAHNEQFNVMFRFDVDSREPRSMLPENEMDALEKVGQFFTRSSLQWDDCAASIPPMLMAATNAYRAYAESRRFVRSATP